jgi:hypothetical protein
MPARIKPSECAICRPRLELTYRRRLLNTYRSVLVETWCRICGHAEILEVALHYGHAVRYFYALDDQPMVHYTHEEPGGWGVHWRLDDVLRLVFPGKHKDELWPKPCLYPESVAEDCDIEMVTRDELRVFRSGSIDKPRRILTTYLNRQRMTRDELAKWCGSVWDEMELERDFEVLGHRDPFVLVQRRLDGVRGSVLVQSFPRYYFAFDTRRLI